METTAPTPEAPQPPDALALPVELPPEDDATQPDLPVPTGATRAEQALARLHVSRRTVLIAGGGVVVLGAAGVVAKQLHIPSRIRDRLARLRGTVARAPIVPVWPAGPLATPHDVVIFDGALAAGWADWSWAKRSLNDMRQPFNGKAVLSMELRDWSGVQLHHTPFSTSGYGYLQCQVRCDGTDPQVNVYFLDGSNAALQGMPLGLFTREHSISRDGWRLARIPLDMLKAAETTVQTLILQADGTGGQGTVYVADLRVVFDTGAYPPTVESGWAYDLATITLAFRREMQADGAADVHTYAITAAAGNNDPRYSSARPVMPREARYHPDEHTVSLLVPEPLKAGSSYLVTLNPILDRFGLSTAKNLSTTVQVTRQPLQVVADPTRGRHTISPEIYGAASVDARSGRDLGVTVSRWGGNAVTRYNWKLGNAFNASRNYYYMNGNYGHTSPADRQPSGVVDQWVEENQRGGMHSLITVPGIGWVAKDDNPGSRSLGVPWQGGPPLRPGGDAIAGYDPTVNRQRTSVPSRARKGAPFSDPPDRSDRTVAQDEWIYHLVRRFGRADQGGVRYYTIDNEPELWWTTHGDIRPAQLSYDQLRDIFLDYATAIKAVDPSAQVSGPAIWDPRNFKYSPLGMGTNEALMLADRRAHGDVPFMEWWLREVRAHDERIGQRTLDMVDVHVYPQGNTYSEDASPKTAALRLRLTRELWDPNYVEETWIKERLALIPRMHEWVRANYPGTRIGIGEYGWGAEKTMNGAVALADVLGIYGREDLDQACLWGAMTPDMPTYQAFKLYGNYDSRGSAFLGTSFSVSSTESDVLSSFGTQTPDGAVLLMVVNKTASSDVTPTLLLHNLRTGLGGASPRRARIWRLWPGDGGAIREGTPLDLSRASDNPLSLTYTFPYSSITLFRIEAGA